MALGGQTQAGVCVGGGGSTATLNVTKQLSTPVGLCIDGCDKMIHCRMGNRESLIQGTIVPLQRVVGPVHNVIPCVGGISEVPQMWRKLVDLSSDRVTPKLVELVFISSLIKMCSNERDSFGDYFIDGNDGQNV